MDNTHPEAQNSPIMMSQSDASGPGNKAAGNMQGTGQNVEEVEILPPELNEDDIRTLADASEGMLLWLW